MPRVMPASPNDPTESTSAEALSRYIPGRPLRESVGPAWGDLRVRLLAQETNVPEFSVPAVPEAFLVWVRSGCALVEERTTGGDWAGTTVGPGDLFLTAPGGAYDLRLRLAAPEPFVTVQALFALPLLARAGAEVCGDNEVVRLRDRSAFRDRLLEAAMAALAAELERTGGASGLLVRGLAQAVAVHLVRHYTARTEERRTTGGLPGHVLRRITDRMAAALAEPFSLDRWAGQARMSPSHFSRAFKQSTGLSPSRHALNLRLAEARRLLRETDESVIQIALAVGYGSPSHFAQVFRRETGLAPQTYRRSG